jgi:hypothetical protein
MLLVGCSSSKQATSDASKAAVTEAINKNDWVFTANYVMPQSGRSRTTTSVYTVTYSENKFLVDLPYFGRAYSASIGSTESVLNFKTSDFDISKNMKKEGEWDITVKPKDYKEVQTLNFSLYANGSAGLSVILTNRSPISFRGTVAPKK